MTLLARVDIIHVVGRLAGELTILLESFHAFPVLIFLKQVVLETQTWLKFAKLLSRMHHLNSFYIN